MIVDVILAWTAVQVTHYLIDMSAVQMNKQMAVEHSSCTNIGATTPAHPCCIHTVPGVHNMHARTLPIIPQLKAWANKVLLLCTEVRGRA